jgi:hypothetical protein
VTIWSPAVALKTSGGASGVTLTSVDVGPAPPRLVAATLNEYVVPLVSPLLVNAGFVVVAIAASVHVPFAALNTL